jgi:hypothetical protein
MPARSAPVKAMAVADGLVTGGAVVVVVVVVVVVGVLDGAAVTVDGDVTTATVNGSQELTGEAE